RTSPLPQIRLHHPGPPSPLLQRQQRGRLHHVVRLASRPRLPPADRRPPPPPRPSPQLRPGTQHHLIPLPPTGRNPIVNILGIETSCDETAAAVVGDGYRVHSNVISSQIALH